MDNDRLKHSLAVANKMVEIAKERNLSETEIQELFLLGFVHDIGYRFDVDNKHGVIGGEMLKNSNYKYWKEVYYHGDINSEYASMFLEILNKADMQIDKYGNDVGFDKRLEDIKNRHGEQSSAYMNCVQLIEELKK